MCELCSEEPQDPASVQHCMCVQLGTMRVGIYQAAYFSLCYT